MVQSDTKVDVNCRPVFLGLGGNLGNVRRNFKSAITRLNEHSHIQFIRSSSLFETPPWGIEDQPAFLNCCVEISTNLTPLDLLDVCHAIEKALNRVRKLKWGPRTMDIDILMIDGENFDHERLQIPHPRITERAFVLVPLAQIAPEHVLSGRTVAQWRAQCDDTGIDERAQSLKIAHIT